MNVLWTWLVYLIVVMLGGAAIAPAVYHLISLLAKHINLLQPLAHEPFHRYVHRTILILALVGLYPLCRRLGFRSLRSAGLVISPRTIEDSIKTFLAGFSLVVGIIVTLYLRGLWIEQGSFTRVFSSVAACTKLCAKAIFTGLTVGTLEELLFRGLLVRSLAQAIRPTAAVWAASITYAWMHLFSEVKWVGPVRWDSGLQLLQLMLHGWTDPIIIWPAAINLTLLGMTFGLLYLKHRHLLAPIGLHAGIVTAIKLATTLFKPIHVYSPIYGGKRLFDGWLVLPILVLCLVWIHLFDSEQTKGQNQDLEQTSKRAEALSPDTKDGPAQPGS